MENKGMYKLKYFCQVCNRQCNDRDGFNCHLNSVTHKKNIERVARNPEEYINKYSKEFEFGFVDVLKRISQGEWTSANKIYQEYISDRDTIHLNATRWESLSAFIRYLGDIGKCKVMPKETDTLIKYIDDSPIVIQSKKLFEKKAKTKEIEARHMEKQLGKFKEQKFPTREQANISVGTEDFKSFSIELKPKRQVNLPQTLIGNKRQIDRKESEKEENMSRPSILDDRWLSAGLIVRIKDKSLSGGKYFNKKGLILNLHQDYIAELDTEGTKLKIDQELLEPVIPQVGSYVQVIKAEHKGEVGILSELNLLDKTIAVKLKPKDEVIKTNILNICKLNKAI